jgi:hypothetical protein
MGALVKGLFATGTVLLLIGYLAGAAYIQMRQKDNAAASDVEKSLLAARRDLLYAQNAKLESSKAQLTAQLQYELESARNMELRDKFMGAAGSQYQAETGNRTSLEDALAAQKTQLEAQLKAQAAQAKAAEDKRLAQIKQRTSSSSSGGGSSRTTRAS